MKKSKIPLSPCGGLKKVILLLILFTLFPMHMNMSSILTLQQEQTYDLLTDAKELRKVLSKTDKEIKKKNLNTKSTKKKTKRINKVKTFKHSSSKKIVHNSKGKQIVNYSKQFNGNPYVHGGTSLTNGADCSGFTQSVYKHFNKSLPRTVKGQIGVGTKVSFKSLKQGDLIFYSNGGSKPTHVAIYIGNNKVIHASNPQDGIKISPLNMMHKVSARRISM